MNANFLRSEMVKCGMTQKELAKSIGISENSLSRKMTGKREFTLKEATAICAVLHICDPANIFLRESSQIRNNILK